MKIAICHLTGVTPYSSSRPFDTEYDSQIHGPHDDHDAKYWPEHLSLAPDKTVVIPFMSFKFALAAAAKLTQRKLKGNQTFGKTMETGLQPDGDLRLGIDAADVKCEKFYCNSDGVRGSGKRVWRRYPMIFPWAGSITFYLLNPAIEKKIFETYLEEAGMFIGVGRFRAEKGGTNGRWTVKNIEWTE